MNSLLIGKMILLPFGILSPAFFSGTESILTSLSKSELERLKLKHSHRKFLFDFLEKNLDRVLATTIIGNTLAMVLCGVMAASIGNDCASLWNWPHAGVVNGVTFLVSCLVILFGELLPKILGRAYAFELAPLVLIPLVPMAVFIHPLVQICVRLTEIFIQFFGREKLTEIPPLTAAELKEMMEIHPLDGTLQERRILKNILEFGHLRVRDIQKPLEKMVSLSIDSEFLEVLLTVHRTPYSRFPCFKGSLDNIVGIIYSKDLLTAWRTEGLVLIPDLLRPVYFVSPDLYLSDLLREFMKGHHHFAIVRNSEGKISGWITIEDVLEEIVGEVYDEYRLA